MTQASFRILQLDGRERSGFICTSDPLTRYFHTQVTQDTRRRIAACYIAVHQATDTIAGFYTLSAADIPLTDLPAELTKRLPRYPTLPAARLGRLAVDRRFMGQKLGSILLADAVMRAAASEIAVFAMVVDAKDEAAAAFYRHHGFEGFGGKDRQMIVSLARFAPKPT